MSNALNPMLPVKIVDPVLDFSETKVFPVIQGGERTSYKPIISTSYSNSSATFSAPPPSPNVAVSRHVKLVQPVTFTITGNAPIGFPLIQSGFDAPRAYPCSTNMSTLQIDMNNTSFTINMADTIQALLRYNNCTALKNGNMSTTPTYLDTTQQYSDINGSILNPLNSVVDTPLGGCDPRGAFPADSIVNPQSTDEQETIEATVAYTFTEDLFLSPLVFGTNEEDVGFVGLQTFQLIINWRSDLSRMWCHDTTSNANFISLDVTLGQPTLLFQYKTPSPTTLVPRFKNYDYYEVQRYPTEYGTAVPAGSTIQMSSNNIQLNSIPRHVYVYARKRNSDQTFLDADVYFGIKKISVNWVNNSGLLSNASQQDLYEMSRKNGCDLKWREWSGKSAYFSVGDQNQAIKGPGSVFCMEFGTDIALSPNEAPGLNGLYQLQMEVTIENLSEEDINPALYVVVINEGSFTIENNSAYAQVGVISQTDVMNAQKQEGYNYQDLKFMAGSSFRGFTRKLRRAIRMLIQKGPGYARQAADWVERAAPIAAKVGALAGLGYQNAPKEIPVKRKPSRRGRSVFK